ncbi:CcmD family protein [Caldinitratiruptor microaerophilus]|uniref:CcmD family protein n=1 Tax=Caldinitratiruptor microaerophilus TaxID=671077 RepID=A0AA35CKT2_9FIRM|nr:CcmD family protein [Caldinitratiruptor microaerophilus]BDG61125.1 hypothetical protein caldi_22150 [Caldinitratiruptor microaerophilus]
MIYLFFGYAAVWVLLFAYLLVLSARQRRLEEELQTVRERLAPRE